MFEVASNSSAATANLDSDDDTSDDVDDQNDNDMRRM